MPDRIRDDWALVRSSLVPTEGRAAQHAADRLWRDVAALRAEVEQPETDRAAEARARVRFTEAAGRAEASLQAEIEQLRAQRAAVLARHRPDARMGYDDVRCDSCTEESWPCTTVREHGAETEILATCTLPIRQALGETE